MVFLQMELLDGETLKTVLSEIRAIGPSGSAADQEIAFLARMEYSKPIYDAIHYAHAKSVYHGDLHSNNIIITGNRDYKDGKSGQVKIIDFGTSIFADSVKASRTRESNKLADLFQELMPSYKFKKFMKADVRALSPERTLESCFNFSLIIQDFHALTKWFPYDNPGFERPRKVDDWDFRNFLHGTNVRFCQTPVFNIQSLLSLIATIEPKDHTNEYYSSSFLDHLMFSARWIIRNIKGPTIEDYHRANGTYTYDFSDFRNLSSAEKVAMAEAISDDLYRIYHNLT